MLWQVKSRRMLFRGNGAPREAASDEDFMAATAYTVAARGLLVAYNRQLRAKLNHQFRNRLSSSKMCRAASSRHQGEQPLLSLSALAIRSVGSLFPTLPKVPLLLVRPSQVRPSRIVIFQSSSRIKSMAFPMIRQSTMGQCQLSMLCQSQPTSNQ